MFLVPAKTPKIIKLLYPNYIWDMATLDKVLYLTFDDGPTPEITSWVLRLLKQYNAKATFFCIGNNVKKHPELFSKLLKDGHRIGNHTHQHKRGWGTPLELYIQDVENAQIEINALTKNDYNHQSLLFRPPYGKVTRAQASKIKVQGYKIIMWDVLSFDWDANTTKENCLKYVTSKSKNGSIIVFHDSKKAAKNLQYALPRVLQHFAAKGYVFKSLPNYM